MEHYLQWDLAILLKEIVRRTGLAKSFHQLVAGNLQCGKLQVVIPSCQGEESSLYSHRYQHIHVKQLSHFKLACKLCRDRVHSMEIGWLNLTDFGGCTIPAASL